MRFDWHKLVLLTCSAFVLASCGPKKTEETQTPTQEQVTSPPVAQPEAQGSTLTPQQQEELKLEEENVFDTNPPG